MLIYLTTNDYLMAAGRSKTTLKRRIKIGHLIPIKGRVKAVMYDTGWVSQLRTTGGPDMSHEWPTAELLTANGIRYKVLTDGTPKDCKTYNVSHSRTIGEPTVDHTRTIDVPQMDQGLLDVLGKLPAGQVPKTTGYVHLHRRLLSNSMISVPHVPGVFMELLLLATSDGVVSIDAAPGYMVAIGAGEYAIALGWLEAEGIVKLDVMPSGLSIKILKWGNYQPDPDNDRVVIRDMNKPGVEIRATDEDAPLDTPFVPPLSSPPTPPLSNTPYNPPKDIGQVNNIYNARLDEIPGDKNAQEETTTAAPAKPKSKSMKYRNIKEQADPYKLEQYEPKFRPHVPDAHNVYEYYRDKTGATSTRIRALDRIIPLLMVYSKEELVACVDNYYTEFKRKKWEDKYLKRAENFFNEYFMGYMSGELPVHSTKESAEKKKKIKAGPEMKVIKVTEQDK
jgi:hypothetical protein